MREGLPSEGVARDVEAVSAEGVAKRAKEPLPLPRADPDARELRPGGDGPPGRNLSDNVEDELPNVALYHGSCLGSGFGGSHANWVILLGPGGGVEVPRLRQQLVLAEVLRVHHE